MNKYVIFCLLGAALLNPSAARVLRDVSHLSHGYNYQAGASSSFDANILTPPAIITSSPSYVPAGSSQSYYNAIPSFVSSGGLGGSGFAPSSQTFSLSSGGNGYSTGSGSNFGSSGLSFGGSSPSFSTSHVNYDEQQAFQSHIHAHQAPIVTKHFYVHSAPEDHDEQQIVRYINVGRPQQNYRVVFIKAPSSSVSKAKIIANVAPVEDKTAIYVLAKKSNALDVSAEVVTPAPTYHKPEVFFIKYKTADEAAHAQQVIQSQYDSLGGSSQFSDEGTVPVSSVIGSLGGGGSAGSSGSGSSGISYDTEQSQNIGSAVNIVSTGDNTQQTYLPAKGKI